MPDTKRRIAPAVAERMHPFDRWLSTLRVVEGGGCRAIIITDADRPDHANAEEFEPDTVRVFRMMMHPGEQAVQQFLEYYTNEYAARLDFHACLTEWLRPQEELWLGSGHTPSQETQTQLSVRFEMDRVDMSSYWGWYAAPITNELSAAFAYDDDDFYSTPLTSSEPMPRLIGLVQTDNPTRSMALLLQQHPQLGSNFLTEEGALPATRIVTDLEDEEVYRLILGECKVGDLEIVSMSPETLSRYKPKHFYYGVEAVEAMTRNGVDFIETYLFVARTGSAAGSDVT